jgi:hypothetical protein
VFEEHYSPEQLQSIAVQALVLNLSEDEVKKRHLWIGLDGIADYSDNFFSTFKEPANLDEAMVPSKRRQRLQRSQRTAYSLRVFADEGWDVAWSQPQKVHVPGSKAYPIMGIRSPLLEQRNVEPGDILQFEKMKDHLEVTAFAKNMGPPVRGSASYSIAQPLTGLMHKSVIPVQPAVVAPMKGFFKHPGLTRVPPKASEAKKEEP